MAFPFLLAFAILPSLDSFGLEEILAPVTILLAFVALFVGLVVFSRAGSGLGLERIEGYDAYLSGACKEFLGRLPKVPPRSMFGV